MSRCRIFVGFGGGAVVAVAAAAVIVVAVDVAVVDDNDVDVDADDGVDGGVVEQGNVVDQESELQELVVQGPCLHH